MTWTKIKGNKILKMSMVSLKKEEGTKCFCSVLQSQSISFHNNWYHTHLHQLLRTSSTSHELTLITKCITSSYGFSPLLNRERQTTTRGYTKCDKRVTREEEEEEKADKRPPSICFFRLIFSRMFGEEKYNTPTDATRYSARGRSSVGPLKHEIVRNKYNDVRKYTTDFITLKSQYIKRIREAGGLGRGIPFLSN
jgi:hypothetical protein